MIKDVNDLQKRIIRKDIVILKQGNMYIASVKNNECTLISKKKTLDKLYMDLRGYGLTYNQ